MIPKIKRRGEGATPLRRPSNARSAAVRYTLDASCSSAALGNTGGATPSSVGTWANKGVCNEGVIKVCANSQSAAQRQSRACCVVHTTFGTAVRRGWGCNVHRQHRGVREAAPFCRLAVKSVHSQGGGQRRRGGKVCEKGWGSSSHRRRTLGDKQLVLSSIRTMREQLQC